MRSYLVTLFALLAPTFSAAAECETVIALSKVTNTLVSDKSTVEQHANSYCGEYKKDGGKSASSSFGASYKFLSATMSNADASYESVASRYCSSDAGSAASKDAYRQYVESIAPNAYPAYEECIRFTQQDLGFRLSPSSVLAREFSIVVSYRSSNGAKETRVSYTSSEDVKCTWDDVPGKQRVIKTGSSSQLQCKRKDQSLEGYVQVANLTGTKESLTIPWPRYTKDGVQVSLAAELQKEVAEARAQLVSARAAIANLQKGFAGLTAPSGCYWSDYQQKWELEISRGCKDGEFVRAAGFRHDQGRNGTHEESVRLQCCPFPALQ